MKKIKEIKEASNQWLVSKKDEDEQTIRNKEIKRLLNKITAENFEIISQEILTFAKVEANINALIDNIVRKAWEEPSYTKSYAQLVILLSKYKYKWDKSKKRNTIKKKVLKKVEEEYINGFQSYYEFTKDIHEDKSLSQKEKFNKLIIKKKTLIGNINFICELFQLKFLSFIIFKMIILLGIYNFVKEYIRTEVEKDKFSIKEDYLEALMRIFENSGKVIEVKEEKAFEKVKKEKKDIKDDINLILAEEILDEIFEMIDNEDDRTRNLMDKTSLDKYAKSPIKISFLFFEFLRDIMEKNISIRTQSLILNLQEYKNTNWKVIQQKTKAAKKLSEVKKEFERIKEKNQQEAQEYYEEERYNKRNGGYHNKKNYKNNNNNGGYYKKKDREQEEDFYYKKNDKKKIEMNIDDIKSSVLKFCKASGMALNKENYNKHLLEKYGDNKKKILQAYFETFCKNTKKSELEEKIIFPVKLLEEKLISENDFLEAFSKSHSNLYIEYSDMPFLNKGLSQIIFEIVNKNIIALNKFDFSKDRKDIEDPDELEEFQYYINTLAQNVVKVFKDNNAYDGFKEDCEMVLKVSSM